MNFTDGIFAKARVLARFYEGFEPNYKEAQCFLVPCNDCGGACLETWVIDDVGHEAHCARCVCGGGYTDYSAYMAIATWNLGARWNEEQKQR